MLLLYFIKERGKKMKLFKKKKREIDLTRVPKHIAFIMDGNGRWAKKRGLPRVKGHEEGAKRIGALARAAHKLGLEAVTLFAFSTENWKRPKEEVDFIFSLLEKMLKEGKENFKKNDIRVKFIGKIDELDDRFSKIMKETMEETKDNKGIILNLAINYGARSELVEVVKKVGKDCVEGKQDISKIDEKTIEKYLMTNGLPEIDLMVRTSGEVRISNFLLWQIAYSELVFTDVYWPDFNEEQLENVIIEYQSRDRRFGGLK